MLKTSVAELPDRVERKPLKWGEARTSETFVPVADRSNLGGKLFELSIGACGYTKDIASGKYGVSPSLLTRQINNQDNQHLSFQRVCAMPPAFVRDIAMRMLASVDGVRVRTVIEIEEESAA